MNIAILGLGTIGSGVYELLKDNPDINVKKILDIRCWMDNMTTDIEEIVSDDSIELVVETMGGIHPAREYALKCLEAGKSYVSANKLLISECAFELQETADKRGAALLFSAACGGGIPFLYNLKKTKQTDDIVSLGGILNGTCNYILDKVSSEGISYEDALKQAQELGYAEKDPSSDVEGLDTLRKLLLSCAVAFGILPDKNSVPCYGISRLSDVDIEYAKHRNCVIRFMAFAGKCGDGGLNAAVIPVLTKNGSIESGIRLNVNYAWYKGARIGEFGYTGQGAGKFPTANNIVRDIYAVMQGERRMLPESFSAKAADNTDRHCFYVRMPDCRKSALREYCTQTKSKDEYCICITKPISFKELAQVLSKIDDCFVMLMEE